MQFPSRWQKWTIAAALAAVLLAVGLYFLRGPLLFEPAARALEKAVQQATGYECRLGGIAGSLFGDLEIRGVTLVGPDPGRPFLEARIERLRLTYHLWDLRQGLAAGMVRAHLAVEAADVILQPANLPDDEVETPPPIDPQAAPDPLPALPSVEIRGSRFRLVDDDFAMDFGGIDLSPSGTVGTYRLTVADGAWTAAQTISGHSRLEAQLQYAGAEIVLEDVLSDGRLLAPQARVDLRGLPETMPFSGQLAAGAQFLAFEGMLEGDLLRLKLKGRELAPDQLADALGLDSVPITGRCDLQAEATFDLIETDRMRLALQLESESGGWADLRWDRLAVQGGVEGGRIVLAAADLHQGPNHLRLEAASWPLGPLLEGKPREALGDLSGRLTAEIEDISALLHAWGVIPPELAAGPPAHRLELKAHAASGELTIAPAHLTVAGGMLDVQRLVVSLRPLLDTPRQARLEAEVKVEQLDLSQLSALFGLPAMAGRLRGGIHASGPAAGLRLEARLNCRGTIVSGVSLGDGELVATSDGLRLVVQQADFRNGQDRLSIQGRLALDAETIESGRVDWSLADAAAYSAPWLPPAWRFAGPLRGTLALQGPWADPGLSLQLSAGAGRLGGMAIAAAKGEFAGRLDHIIIERIQLESARGDIDLKGTLSGARAAAPLALELETLHIRWGATRMQLAQPGRIHWDSNTHALAAQIALTGSAGRAALEGTFAEADGYDLSLTLEGVNSRHWLDALGIDGVSFNGLNTQLRLEGNRQAPRAVLSGRLDALTVAQAPHPLAGVFECRYTSGVLEILRLDWDDGQGQRAAFSGQLPLAWDDPGHWQVGAMRLQGRIEAGDLGFVRAIAPAYPFEGGVFNATLEVAGTPQSPRGEMSWSIRDLRPHSDSGLPAGVYQVAGNVRLQDGLLEIVRLSAEAPQFGLNAQGAWHGFPAPQDWDDLVRMRHQGQVDLTAVLNSDDLRWVALLMPGVRRTAGRLEARAELKGPLSSPEMRATLRLEGGELQPETDMPALRALEARLSIDSQKVQIQQLSGELGSAPFQIEGGLNRGPAAAWASDLRLVGTNLLLYRREGLRLRADTDLRLSGTETRPMLAGRVALTSGLFTRNIDYLSTIRGGGAPRSPKTGGFFTFPDPPLRDLVFDVRLVGQAPFRLKTAHLRGALDPDLHLGGTGELPELSGRVRVDNAKLRLPGGVLDFNWGTIVFDGDQPEQARLNLRGEGRMFDHDVTALVEGTIAEPQITLSSIPPLAGEALTMMLLTGTPPPRGNQPQNSGAEMKLAVFVGRDMLARLFADEEEESWEQVLERFELEMGRGITRSGEETINARFRLADNVWREGDTIYITGERDVFDYYNAGLRFVLRFR